MDVMRMSEVLGEVAESKALGEAESQASEAVQKLPLPLMKQMKTSTKE